MDVRKIVEYVFKKEGIEFKEVNKIYREKDRLNYFLFGRNNTDKGDEYISIHFKENLRTINLQISLESGIAMLPVCSFVLDNNFNLSFNFLIGNIYSKNRLKEEVIKYLELIDSPDENRYNRIRIFNVGNDINMIKDDFTEAIERCNGVSSEYKIKESTGFIKKEIMKIIMAFLDICAEYRNIKTAIVENEAMYI